MGFNSICWGRWGQIFILDFRLISLTPGLQAIHKTLPFLRETISIVKNKDLTPSIHLTPALRKDLSNRFGVKKPVPKLAVG